jgi:protein TonB
MFLQSLACGSGGALPFIAGTLPRLRIHATKLGMGPTPLPAFRAEDDGDSVVVPLARTPQPWGPRETGTSALTRRTLEGRWLVVSIAAHFLIVGVLMLGLLEASRPVPLPILTITLVPQGPGGEGAAGGNGGSSTAAAPEPAKPDMPPPAPEPISPPVPSQPELPPPQPAKPEMPPPTPPAPEMPPPTPTPVEQPPPQTPPIPQPPKPMAMAPPPVAVEIPPPKPHRVPPPHRPAPRHVAPAKAVPPPVLAPLPAGPSGQTPATAPTTTTLAAPGAGNAGVKPGPGKGVEGAGKGVVGPGAGPGNDYLERLYRHLLRYKKYPPEALSAKQQGSVVVGFTIARDGAVSDARIEKSSGSRLLDAATLALLRRAAPVPPLPDSFKGGAARVKFPIDYKLSLIDQIF